MSYIPVTKNLLSTKGLIYNDFGGITIGQLHISVIPTCWQENVDDNGELDPAIANLAH
jgi:hypothetical protein